MILARTIPIAVDFRRSPRFFNKKTIFEKMHLNITAMTFNNPELSMFFGR